MRDVLIALLPATVAAIVLFGFKALVIIAVCVGSAIASEFLFNLICKKKQTVGDLSAVVTGLLLALNLSTNVSIWQCLVGSVFAIVVVKCLFGGIGHNFANPAITARVLLLVAFPTSVAGGAMTQFAELSSGATPLKLIEDGKALPSIFDMLFGNIGGAIGETCSIALIIGFVYLLIRRVISWHTPVIFVGTVFVLSLIFRQNLTYAIYEVLGGGLLLGAIFMATDYTTTPINKGGKILFAVGCALITCAIRFWSDSYPEGVSFAILLMNIVSPYLEKLGTKRPFGVGGKKHGKKYCKK